MLFLLLATLPFTLGLKPADIEALSDLPLPEEMPCDTVDDGYVCKLEKSRVWGKDSPFHSTGSEDSRKPPPGCKVKQVSLLGRHGVRGGFAEEDKDSRNKVRLEILKALSPEIKKKYPFFEEEVPVDPGPNLQPLGRHQAVNTGIRLAQDYPALAKIDTPVVRSSSSTRVLETALYIMRGFEDRRRELIDDLDIDLWKPNDLTEANSVVGLAYIPPRLEKPQRKKWKKYEDWVLTSQKEALSELLGVELPVYDLEEERKYCYDQVKNLAAMVDLRYKTEADRVAGAEGFFQQRQRMHLSRQITYLDSYCRSDTLLSIEGSSISQWCDLFTSEYFNNFIDYSESAYDWPLIGPGSSTLPTQVEIWVKELCARMLGHEEGIFTIGAGASPFNRKIYIDLTHYENIYPALAILGLIDTSDPPSFDHPQVPPKRPRTTTGATIPMGARLIVEVLDCSPDISLRARAGSRRASKDDSELHVRFILNDGVRKVTDLTDDGPGPGVYALRSVLEMVKKSLGNQ